jgi:hypothetical protein
VSSAFLVYRVVYVIDNSISEQMLFEKIEIEKQIALQPDLQHLHFIMGDRLEIQPISSFTTVNATFKDTTFYDFYEKGNAPYRVLTYQQLIKGSPYRIEIARRLTKNDQLMNGILWAMLLVTLDIIICFYFLNRWFSNRVWNSFYRALNILKNFDIQRGGSVQFQGSKVDEFKHIKPGTF